MFNKKICIIFLLVMFICSISIVSANENVTEIMETDDSAEITAVDESYTDEPTVDEEFLDENLEESGEEEELAVSPEVEQLTQDQSEDLLGIWYFSPAYNDYKVSFQYPGGYNLHGSMNKKVIKFYVDPYKTSNIYYYKYDFIISVYDGYTEDAKNYYWGNRIFQSERICGADFSQKKLCSYTFPERTFKAGNYYIVITNYYDNVVMAGPTSIKVYDDAVITANDYNAFYNSGAQITVRLTDKKSGVGLNGVVKATFSNGVTNYYTTDSNGYASFIPPLGIGKYTVTFAPANEYLTAASIQKNINIKKAYVKVKAHKVKDYKGFKITLKASVKSNGKNVNEGTVAFKIKGKTYKVPVRNGMATKKIKLKKVKSYKYTAQFLGNKNLYKSKKSKSKAALKNRLNVKVSFKRPVVYMGQAKKVKIKITAKGKKVKSGWLQLKHRNGVDTVRVKNGKVVAYATGLSSDLYKGSNGYTSYYKKAVHKKYWVKYVPSEHKYKPKKVKYTGTTKYKCPQCGKKSTHYHYEHGYFRVYAYKIKVS